MSVLDHLKAQSQKQRGKAVSPEVPADDLPADGLGEENSGTASSVRNSADHHPSSARKQTPSITDPNASKAKPAPDQSRSTTAPAAPIGPYCAYWIGQLEKLKELSPDAADKAARAAIQKAPSYRRPPVEEARLIVLAGGKELPYQDVIDWLTLRAALADKEGAINPEIARYWLRQLGAPPTASVAEWPSRCQQVAQNAVRVGQGLSPTTVAALVAHPEAARGYLRCSGAKARLCEADARVTAVESSETLPNHPAHLVGNDPNATTAQPVLAHAPEKSAPADIEAGSAREPSPLLAKNPPSLPPPVTGSPSAIAATPGTGVGLALGGLAGGLVGGVLGGLRAGVNHAFADSASATEPGPTRFSPDWFRKKMTDIETHAREQKASRAVADAAGALGDFVQSARQLEQHPNLVIFWRDIDQQATTRFGGNRAAVLQEMAGQPVHPLRALFERQARADPDVALHHERAYAGYARLQTAWKTCAQAHQNLGQRGWAPTAEQIKTLREACRRVPPGKDRPALIEQAERLLRDLAQAVRQVFNRARTPSAGPAP